MSGANTTTRWMLGRGGWAVGLVLGLAVAGAGSCLGPNRGHCLYRGGDLACGTGICVFAPEGGTAEGVGDDGCLERGDVPAGFFHARYGLPARREAAAGDPTDVAAVEGLLLQLTDGERSVTEEELARFFGPADDPERVDAGVIAIRDELAREGGVVKTKYDVKGVEGPQCDAAEVGMAPICSYYAAIDAWLAEQPPGTSTSTDTVATETTTDETATTSSGETTEPECTASRECTDEARPVCDPATGTCVACDAVEMPDQACAEKSAEQPLCVEGRCVQCTEADATVCTAQGLLCDEESGECMPCTEHGQCEVGACAKVEGMCFPADALVLHVDEDMGVPKEYYASVGAAVSAVVDGGVAVIVVHAIDDGSPYTGAPRIDGGKTIALLAAADEQPTLQGVNNPGLRVEGAGTVVYTEGLRISQSSGMGLQVTGARAWVDRSWIVQNTGGGIVAQSEATLTLRNSFVGGGVDDANALDVNGATGHILYSTLGAGTNNAVGLACAAPVSVVVRNSIIVARGLGVTAGFDVVCDDAAVAFSATETMIDGMGNDTVGEMPNLMPEQWFVGYTSGDFHLQNEGLTVFAGVAQWQSGDPPTDIDGTDFRPMENGAADYAGADVP